MELFYDSNKKNIYYQSENLGREIIDKNTPSKPMISPNKKLAVYIAPFEWEVMGSIYLIDLENMVKDKIYEPRNDALNPKNIMWINNGEIAVILGYAYGTIAIGGNVFNLNLATKELTQLTHFSDDIQINSVSIKNSILTVSGIKYTDPMFLNTEEYTSRIDLSTRGE